MITSASVPLDQNAPKLVRGNTMHQVLSTDKFIFYISSHFEKLYRKQFHRERISNEVNQTLVFRKVQPKNFSKSSIYGTNRRKISGDTMAYLGIRYDVYALFDKHLRGYMIVPKRGLYSHTEDPCQKIFFEYERKER